MASGSGNASFSSVWRRRRGPDRGAPTSWISRRVAWTLAYVLVATLCFTPGLTLRPARFRAGSVASHDVVAPRDFLLPDADATVRKRQDASGSVLPVYDHSPQLSAELDSRLHRAFSDARDAAASGRRPKGLATGVPFEVPIEDAALDALARNRFSSDLEVRLQGIAARLYRAGIVENRELLLENRDRGVVFRDTDTGAEHRTIDLFSTVEYGNDLRAAISSDLAGAGMSAPDTRAIAGFLASCLRPNLTFNAAETARRRESAAASVQSILIRVPRGEVVVRRGDVVTPKAASVVAMIGGSASEPELLMKLGGVALLQILIAIAFWTDSRVRARTLPSEPVPLVPLLAVGVVSALLTRAGFGLAQAISASFSSEAFSAAHLAIPFAAGPILAVLIAGVGPGPAVLLGAAQAISVGVLLGGSFRHALVCLAGSLAGIYGMKQLGARSVLLVLGGVVGLGNGAAVVASHALSGDWAQAGGDIVTAVLGGFVVAAIVAFLLPVFEWFFHVTTDIRLLELSNLNLPLLRTLALEAPGTYQHSLMVGQLAEAAAESTGANPLLARVCAYYHDIGKTKMPEYFIENQPRGQNRHDRLEPSMSALIIAAHVKEGIELARRQRLPEPIVNGIREHHGTKLIRYFYQKALSRVAAGGASVEESDYRYPGPKPSNRISGILMLADATEAASRTIAEPTPAKIAGMVRAIANDCLRDGQLDDCDLTLRDVSRITEALIRTVSSIHHHRIDYPGFDFNSPEPEPGAARPTPGREGAGVL